MLLYIYKNIVQCIYELFKKIIIHIVSNSNSYFQDPLIECSNLGNSHKG